MKTIVLVGAQWGDEGKGKITDFLAEKADVVVRASGGNNAGHTVAVNGETYKLHLIPSGILYSDKLCIIGSGTVIDPQSFLQELDYLDAKGISTDNLIISDRAHVVLPYHRMLDGLSEEMRGKKDIGTTKKGIGPAYTDKAERTGIRMCDFIKKGTFIDLISDNIEKKNMILKYIYKQETINAKKIIEQYREYADRLSKYVIDTSVMLYNNIKQGKKVLFEGAQGTLLDIDHGTYPYVTSSNPTAGGAPVGAGIGPTMIDGVIGIAKAYTTRVGKGPFPTELLDETGEAIREKGHEYGTTTGRPRRCGWLDAVILRYAARINGLSGFAVTRMDTLGGFDKVKICVGYKYEGKVINNFPASLLDLAKCEPVYEELEGWTDNISHIRKYEDLPQQAKNYIKRIEELTDTEVKIVSVGPGRDETIQREDLL